MTDFNEFIKKFGNNYDAKAREYIIENYYRKIDNSDITPDLLNQIYSFLGRIPDNKNLYIQILEMLEYYFKLDRDILEIGCGYFPELARRIDMRQQEFEGSSIIAYDDKLVTTKLGNIKLHKELYIDQLENYNLLLGLMPCKATELIIRKAAKDKKEYFLALCGCSHMYFPFPVGDPSKIYREYILSIAKDTLDKDSTLEIEYLEDESLHPYPILIKKYK